MEVTEKTVGARIKAYIAEKGVKQSFIAEAVGITDSTMSNICNGNIGIDVIRYAKICLALGVPFETFLEGVEA